MSTTRKSLINFLNSNLGDNEDLIATQNELIDAINSLKEEILLYSIIFGGD